MHVSQEEVTPFEILKTKVYPVVNEIILKVKLLWCS